MPTLQIVDYDGKVHSLETDAENVPPIPTDGFATFRGKDKQISIHTKHIAAVVLQKGETP